MRLDLEQTRVVVDRAFDLGITLLIQQICMVAVVALNTTWENTRTSKERYRLSIKIWYGHE